MSKFSMAAAPEWFNLPEWLYSEGGGNVFYIVIGVLAIVACFAIVFFAGRNSGDKKNNTKSTAFGGIMLALATVLSMIRIYHMPQGGTVTPASLLPLALYSYVFGARKGVLVCFAYGMLQALLEGWIVHPIQFLLDYPIAFAVIGFTGAKVFKKLPEKVALPVGLIVCIIARYLVHSLGGMVFFASNAPTQTFGAIFAYSFGYNAFCLVDGAIAVALAFALCVNSSFMKQLFRFSEN